MTCDIHFDLEAKNSFWTLLLLGVSVFHKHTLIFMPPDRMIEGIIFFLLSVCLFVCLLTTWTFDITFEL